MASISPAVADDATAHEQIQRELDAARAERAAIMEAMKAQGAGRDGTEPGAWYSRFTLGGYGEIHYNESVAAEGDYVDIHRFVLYMGYSFSDWIHLHSELEIERAFVSAEQGGYVAFEQLYFDFDLSALLNLRVGRVLAPLGIINQTHEPTTFNGVERPSYSRVILLNTWSLDGAGVYGGFGPMFKYEAYVAAGLDGSRFTSRDGLRGGRMMDRPGTRAPSYSARVDYTPLAALRFGLSYMRTGVRNGPLGKASEVDGKARVDIASADVRFSYRIIDLRLDGANTKVTGADALNRYFAEKCLATSACAQPEVVGKRMAGYMAEVAVHAWPDVLRAGKLASSDLVLFARLDDYDTHAVVPGGAKRDRAADRRDITAGVSFFPDRNVVVKADRQWVRDAAGSADDRLFNLGLGWTF